MNRQDYIKNYSRRDVLRVLGLSSLALLFPGCFSSCEKEAYIRPEGLYPLGDIMELLHPKQHVRDQAILVRLDDDGWSAMSGRCSHEGCDLTYQSNTLLCSCCRSVFDHFGVVLKGPATHNLPYYEMTFKHDQLQADTSKVVPQSYRFMKPSIKDLVKELRLKAVEEGRGMVQIPKILIGQEDDRRVGSLFKLDSEDKLYEAEMNRWEKEQGQ